MSDKKTSSRAADPTEISHVVAQVPEETGIRHPEDFSLPLDIYFRAVEQSPVAISITDNRAKILYANAAFSTVSGFSFEEVNGKSQSILSDRRTPSIVYESLWSSLLRQRPWSGKLVNRKRSGQRYLAELLVAPVTDDDQASIHYLGMHRDVTDQHVLEQAVKNQRALIDALLDHAPMWFVAIDERGEVAVSNVPFRDAQSQFDGNDLAQTLVHQLCGPSPEAFAELRSKKAPIPDREVEVPLRGEPKPRKISVTGRWLDENDASADAFFRRGGQRYFLIFGTDVTPLREQQERVRTNALRELIAEEERVQELSEVLNAAVFRFELPLNLLNAALRSAERRKKDVLSFDTLLQVVRQAVTEGHELLERLRKAVPEAPALPVEEVALGDLLREVLGLSTHRLMAQDIVVDLKADAIPKVPGKPGQLRVLFKELIENAIEAMGASQERSITVEVSIAPGKVIVAVQDTGSGIPETLHFRVFEPFFSRYAHKKDGAGMGLARVQNIVTEHAGTAYVDPKVSRGCRMVVELPSNDEASMT